jgi:hypothetical protein
MKAFSESIGLQGFIASSTYSRVIDNDDLGERRLSPSRHQLSSASCDANSALHLPAFTCPIAAPALSRRAVSSARNPVNSNKSDSTMLFR